MSGFILNFRKQFAAAVEAGAKLQTIRQFRKDGRVPKEGDTLHLWTGLRNTEARRLGVRRATACVTIFMDLERLSHRVIVVEGARLSFVEANSFAIADGFDSAIAMLEWFRDTYKPATSFNGFCVRWSPHPMEAAA